MKSYNTDIECGIHTVEVTLQKLGYVGHFTYRLSGDCYGREVIEYIDFECVDCSFTKNDCNLEYCEEGGIYSAFLKDSEGNKHYVEGDAEDFNNMIVKVEILEFKEVMEEESC